MRIFVHTVVWKECLTQVRREGGGSCGQNRVVSGKWKKVMPDSSSDFEPGGHSYIMFYELNRDSW